MERKDDRWSRDQLADPRGSRPDVWEDQARRAEPGPGPWLESSSRRAGGSRLELSTNLRKVSQFLEKAITLAFSLLKVPTRTCTIKYLLRQADKPPNCKSSYSV